MVSHSSRDLKFLSKPIVQRQVASVNVNVSGSDSSYKTTLTTRTTKIGHRRLGWNATQITVANTEIPTQSMSNAIVISNVSASHSPTIQLL